jgi:NitT/TauT family transport system substrate-binding protein
LKVIYSTITPPTAPLWIAKERGLFEKHGLSVDLVFIESGPRSVQALLSGDAFIATSAGPAVANAKLSGADVVMIGGLVNVFPFFLVTHSGIDSPAALKGKTGATQVFGSGGDLSLRMGLRKLGLDPERDVTLRIIGGSTLRIQALEKRLVDFAMLEPMVMFRAKQLKTLKILVDFTEKGIPYQHNGIITLNSSIKKNRPLVINFLEAVGEGIAFYKCHKQETIAIMAKYARLDDAEVLEASYDWFKKVFLDVPYPTSDGFESILEMLSTYTGRKGVSHLEPGALVDRSLLEELVKGGFFRSLDECSRK